MILDGELVPLDDFWPEELDHINSTMEQIRAQGNPDDEQEEAQKIGIRLPYSIGQKVSRFWSWQFITILFILRNY